MKVICIGEALIDMICTDKGTPLADGQHFLKKAGGAPTNVAAAIAALGGQVELLAKIGDDPFGNHLVDVMEEFGVSTKWMLKDPEHFSSFAFVSLMQDGERDFVFNRGADGFLSSEEVSAIPLNGVSIIHFGSATAFLPGPLQTAYQGLLQRAIQEKIFISFDPNYRHLLFGNQQQTFIDQCWNFLTSCHFFKLSDEEAILVTGAHNVSDAATILLDKTSAVFAITLGKDGTMLAIGGRFIQVPSIKVDVVDTTGAGDAFVGAVLFQLAQRGAEEIERLSENDWISIVTNANKAGAKTCAYMGAMEAFAHLKEGNIFE